MDLQEQIFKKPQSSYRLIIWPASYDKMVSTYNLQGYNYIKGNLQSLVCMLGLYLQFVFWFWWYITFRDYSHDTYIKFYQKLYVHLYGWKSLQK